MMNTILNKFEEYLRKTLRLPNIEQQLGQLCSQIAEQEMKIATTQALMLNQQYLLLERIDLMQQELDRIALLQEQSISREK